MASKDADKLAEGEAAAVPPAQRGTWMSFVKSIASFSGDLSSLTAPPFILSPVSLTEFPAYWCERPELFYNLAEFPSEEERALRVLKWFISTLKGQYTSRNESMGSEKKPLNPVLGEVFYGTWPDQHGRGETTLTVEQVSHHPPITAYFIRNATRGVSLQGHSAQRTSFSAGAIIIQQVGHAILTLELPPSTAGGKKQSEKYLITLPRLRIDGLWYGSPYIELTHTSYIVSSTGWSTAITYSGKRYFGGKAHTFSAVVTPPSTSKAKPRTIEGQWDTVSTDKSTGEIFHDVTTPKEEVTVEPDTEKMDPWESRRLWKLVSKGIREGDFDLASKEKTKIEVDQRQRRKDEKAAGTSWQLRHFDRVDVDPDFVSLAQSLSLPSEEGYFFKFNGPYDQRPSVLMSTIKTLKRMK